MEIYGDNSLALLVIFEGAKEYTSGNDPDSMIVSCDWLTVKAARFATTMTLLAEPNTSDRKRKLRTRGYFGSEYAEIIVTQD